jgi:hypothetical protein
MPIIVGRMKRLLATAIAVAALLPAGAAGSSVPLFAKTPVPPPCGICGSLTPGLHPRFPGAGPDVPKVPCPVCAPPKKAPKA